MTEVGYIKDIKGQYALVLFKRKSGCGENCAHCGAECSSESSTVEIKNTLNAKKGDYIQVSLQTKAFFKMTMWAYIFPLIMLFIGIVLGNNYFFKLGYKNYELFAAITGLFSLVLSYFILGIIDKKMSKDSKYELHMEKIL